MSASGRQQPPNAPTTLGSSRPEPRPTSPPVVDPHPRDGTSGEPNPVDMVERPAKESGAASWGIRSLREPTGFSAACFLLFPFHRIIFRLDKLHPHRSQPLLARQPSSHGHKANGGKNHRLTTGPGSVFVATKMPHRSLSTNHLFLRGEPEPHLAIRGTDQHYGVGACDSRGTFR